MKSSLDTYVQRIIMNANKWDITNIADPVQKGYKAMRVYIDKESGFAVKGKVGDKEFEARELVKIAKRRLIDDPMLV